MFPRLDGERIFSLTSSLLSYSQLERPVTRAKKKKKKKRKRIFQKKKDERISKTSKEKEDSLVGFACLVSQLLL